MLSPLGVKVFHWASATMTVPFAIGACFGNHAEQVEFKVGNTALDLPRPFLVLCSKFVHLTMVSHEMTAGYFVWALLRDHGILAPAPSSDARRQDRKTKGVDNLEVYFAVATAMAMFIATVFWACIAIDTELMVPIDMFFQQHPNLPSELKRRLLFQAFMGPSDPDPRCTWQRPFRIFMKYLHSFCPLLLVADVVCVHHVPVAWDTELRAACIFMAVYLSWNLFGWWLLRVPPYPLQKQVYSRGILQTVMAYVLLIAYGILLLRYARNLRLGGGTVSWLLMSVPVLSVVWASNGFVPFTASLARHQRVKLDATGKVVTIATDESE